MCIFVQDKTTLNILFCSRKDQRGTRTTVSKTYRCATWQMSPHMCRRSLNSLSLCYQQFFTFSQSFTSFLLSFLSDSVIHFALSRSTKESLSFFSLMAETSALCFSPLASIPSISRSSSLSAFTSSHKSSISHSPRPSRPLRFSVKASSDSGNFFADDSFGFFPWSQGDSGNNSSHLLFSHFSFPRFFFFF